MRLAPFVLLLSSCASAPKCPDPGFGRIPGRPFLWRVASRGGGTMTLFGTYHAAGEEDVPPAAWTALSRAKTFVTELPALDRDRYRELARLPRGQSLQAMLSDHDWYDLVDAVVGAGLAREDDLRRMRPWVAASLLTAAMLGESGTSIDEALSERADEQHLEHAHLESWDEQLGAVNDSVDVKDLVEAIHERQNMRCGVKRAIAAYRSGDETRFGGDLDDADQERLIGERNRKWLDKLEELLAGDQDAFVVVGVRHLVGTDGLPELLRERGYPVTRR